MGKTKVIIWAMTLLLWTGVGASQELPLPELEPFLQEARKKLVSDRLLLSQYTFAEKHTTHQLDKQGRVKKTDVRIYEVYPDLDAKYSYRKLVSENGRLLRPEELAKQDREHQERLAKRAKKLDRETNSERAKRLAKREEAQREEQAAIDEAFRLYDIRMAAREVLDGYSTIRFEVSPRPGFKTRTSEGKTLQKFSGTAWITEADHELVRLEVKLAKTLSMGWGLLARVKEGTHATFQRRRVNDEIWLPAEVRLTGDLRLLLVKGMHVDVISEYSDYKKFSVDTAVRFLTELPPR